MILKIVSVGPGDPRLCEYRRAPGQGRGLRHTGPGRAVRPRDPGRLFQRDGTAAVYPGADAPGIRRGSDIK